MIKKIKTLLAGLLTVPVLTLGMTALVPAVVNAAPDCSTDNPSTLTITQGAQCAQGNNTPGNLFGGSGSIFNTVVNIMLFLIGAISVVMLIVGGIRYTVSGGNDKAVQAAKNTILYAIVGLVIAFLAYAIVNWVLGGIGAATNS